MQKVNLGRWQSVFNITLPGFLYRIFECTCTAMLIQILLEAVSKDQLSPSRLSQNDVGRPSADEQ